MANQIMFPPAEIASWQSRKAELEEQIAGIQRELQGINKLLEAVALLAPPEAPKVERRPPPPESEANGHGEQPTLMGSIPIFLDLHKEPITKAALKEKLQQAGFSEAQLGNYFYTVIMRLKKRNMIRVLDDGRVSSVG